MKVLNHPNIVKFKEEFVTIEYLYYVIELVDGMDLFKYVSDKEYLNEHEAGIIMGEILLAVKYLTNVGIVHRDLKPENIMLKIDRKGVQKEPLEVKIIDFGFAMYIKELNATGQCCGTINYVAPEIFQGRPYNFKTDIFSLGVILYFMIRGELPFAHAMKDIVIKNIIRGNFSFDNDEFFLKISHDVKDLISKMLQSKVSERIDIDEALEHPWIVKHQRHRSWNQNQRHSRGEAANGAHDGKHNRGESPEKNGFSRISVKSENHFNNLQDEKNDQKESPGKNELKASKSKSDNIV